MINWEFFRELNDLTPKDVHVGCSDHTFNSLPFYYKKCYVSNVDGYDEDLVPIPLGVKQSFNVPKNIEPQKLAYYCASSRTNVEQREYCKNLMLNNDWCTVEDDVDFSHYINQICGHKFVLSPEGLGYDCYRTWETLYCGRFPIVKRRVFTEEFAKSLPIVIIDNWSEVTETFLNTKYEEMISKDWDYCLLNKQYWKDLITKGIEL